MTEIKPAGPAVVVVEDDASVRDALRRLFVSVGLEVQAHGSASDLLAHGFPDAPCCLVLDIRLPGRSGLDLQEELAKSGVPVPIVFMTGHGDIPMSVRAMKAGAVDFLSKPFRDQDMLDAVFAAIERDRQRRAGEHSTLDLRARFESLTGREREVMALATGGLMNKQIAGKLGLSEITVKIHRGHVTRKMGARNLADLVRMADALGLHAGPPGSERNLSMTGKTGANAATSSGMRTSHQRTKTVPGVVSIVDDDVSVRTATSRLLKLHGFDVRSFASAEALLSSPDRGATRCLIADFAMPGMDGLSMRERLVEEGHRCPVIFITAHAGDPWRSRALQTGALAVLDKPFDGQLLIRLVKKALNAG